MRRMNSLVVFDLDNTLVHSQIDFPAMRAAVTALLREHGATDKTAQELRRLSVGEIIAEGAAHDARHGSEIERTAWQKVLEFEREGMLKATVEEDAAQTLEVLHDLDFRLAILTNNARAATLAALEKFALQSYFDLILTRDEVTMKPAPDGLLTARRKLEAKRVFHVGDAWLDGAAANRAEIPFIAFRPQPDAFTHHEVAVWKCVQHLRELPELLQNL